MPTIDPLSEVKSSSIGKNTRVWRYVVICKGAVIGDDCNICSHAFIEDDVVVGNRVTIKSGVFLWDGTRIDDNVFIGPNVTFTNDVFPRSKQQPNTFCGVTVREGASVGANATLLPGITIGKKAMIGAGSVVTKNVGDYEVVVGNPARVIRTVPHD